MALSADEEATILCREIGRIAGPLGSFGARWAARLLPNVAAELRCDVEILAPTLLALAAQALVDLEPIQAELPARMSTNELLAVVGSGAARMNPTLLRVEIAEATRGASVFARAVAKEGLVKQRSAELALERLVQALRVRLPDGALEPRSVDPR